MNKTQIILFFTGYFLTLIVIAAILINADKQSRVFNDEREED